MTHITCRLTAKNRDQLRNPTLGNWLWAIFTFLLFTAGFMLYVEWAECVRRSVECCCWLLSTSTAIRWQPSTTLWAPRSAWRYTLYLLFFLSSAYFFCWYGHVLRKDDDDSVKKCMEYEVEGSRPRGRPKKTWKEVVREDCQARSWIKRMPWTVANGERW